MHRFQVKVTSIFIIPLLVIGALLVVPKKVSAAAGLNRQINYQGRLLTSAGVAATDGTYNLKFSIYNASSGGTRLWTAVGTTVSPTGTAVVVQGGLFTVQLGDTSAGQNAFDFDWNQDTLFLGVTVGVDSEMSPRKRLTAVPYAFTAENLQGQYASSSVTSTGGVLFNLRQQSSNAAAADRTALYISTSGTSNIFDYLLKASNGSAEVFTVSRQGNVTTTGNLATSGNVILGDAGGDAVIFNGQVNSSIIPTTNNSFDLGSATQGWQDGYFTGTVSSSGIFAEGLGFGSYDGFSSLVVLRQRNGVNWTTTWINNLNPDIQYHDYVGNDGSFIFTSGDSSVYLWAHEYSTDFVAIGDNTSSGVLIASSTWSDGPSTVIPLSFKLQVNGSVGPDRNNLFDLGSGRSSWKDIYASGTVNIGSGGINSQGALSVYTSSSNATTTLIWNSASNTAPVLQVLGGCVSSTGGVLIQAGITTDQSVFKVLCSGDVRADGSFTSPATDFAEYFGSDAKLSAQDVLVLDHATSVPAVKKGSIAERNSVVGVYSTQPSFVGGATDSALNGSSSAVPVALVGRVPTRADATSVAIAAGDPLMAGNNGYAVKAKGPGMILGRALEPLANGTGVISVFVQPMWWAGDLFTGSVWNATSSAAVIPSFNFASDLITASSSLFSVKNANGMAMLTISELGNVSVTGDLTTGRKLYLGSKTTGQGSASTYIYADDTLAPTSTYVATNADGWQTSSTYDYAERFHSNEKLAPGDLVMTDGGGVNLVKRSVSGNATVLGIVSTKPGFVTGAYSSGTYPIALAGRVPTRVSTANGAIQAGDQLAPSDVPGVAVKATAAGPVVGVALEAYDKAGESLISVFVQPGWKGGEIVTTGSLPSSVTYQTTNTQAKTSPRKGKMVIAAGSKEVNVSFPSLNAYPLISVLPYGQVTDGFWITNVTDRGFTLILNTAPTFDLTLAWKAEPSETGDVVSFSDGTSAPYDPLTGVAIGWSPATTAAPLVQEAPSTTTSASSTEGG